MGLRMYNIRLTPRGCTTSIVSPDGVNWFTEDGKPVPIRKDGRPDVIEDCAATDLIGVIACAVILAGVCWLFGLL